MLRLVKVIVQPVVVWDDGEQLTEVRAQPVEVSSADWPAYPAKLAADLEARHGELAATLNGKVQEAA